MTSNVGSLVQDLVEMAEAVKLVPVLQGELLAKTHALDEAQQHNQGLESNIIGYKAQIEDLQSKVRSLEVERDDASFRVMEAEDTNVFMLDRISTIEGYFNAMKLKLDPPKPQPEPEKVQEAPNDPNHGSLQPQAVPLPSAQDTFHSDPDWKQDKAETSVLPKGQSDTTPTERSSQSFGGETTGQGSSEIKGPYVGKRYHDMPNYIPYHDWIEGGGTEENYHWRPNASVGHSF